MDFVSEFDGVIGEVSIILGKPINNEKYRIIDRGMPHRPKSIPTGMMGIYTFCYNGKFLKIGKAGPNSNARFLSQHYNPRSAQSNLAKSILSDKEMNQLGISETNVGEWIKRNCRRIDILLDADLGIFALTVIETALHKKYEPKYEGFSAQR